MGYNSLLISDPLLRKATSWLKLTKNVNSLLVITCGEVQQKEVGRIHLFSNPYQAKTETNHPRPQALCLEYR